MNWITIIWSMVAAICITLGLLELRIGISRPIDLARLFFSVSAFATAWQCFLELKLMNAQSPAQFHAILRCGGFSIELMIASLVAFIWVYFRAGNKWLALAGPCLFAAAVILDFIPGSGRTYLEITSLQTVDTFGGISYSVANGKPSPWNWLTYLAVFMLLLFVLDASLRLASRGGRRRALVIGGSIGLWIFIAGGHSALLEFGILKMPYLISINYLIIVIAISSELTSDVSAAALIGRQLQDSERRLDLATAAAGLGMWSWDLHNQSGWASPKAQRLLGVEESEYLTQTRFVEAIHPDDRETVKLAVGRSMTNDQDLEVEHRVRTPSGETRWVSLRGRIERNSMGRPTLMRGVVLDITLRRRSELDLQRLQSQLAHTSRVSMMGQLATALAHELHQPLGAILRNAEAAELFLGYDPPDLDELRAILIDIRADDQRAREVIDRLRALLKRGSIDPRSLAVPDLLGKIAALTRSDALTRQIIVETDPGSNLPEIIGDAVHLQQVLLNLVLNAMDAIDAAGSAERVVIVRARAHDAAHVEMMVSDTGPGISAAELGLIFDPFFTTKTSGMGIGLSVSRTIIEAHGGRLWAENNAEKGATFRFTLPTATQSVS